MAAEQARKHGIPENIFFGLIRAESSWRPDAVSHAGAMGLTQVMPGTARGMGYDPNELARNPAIQLEAGARYLSQMYNQFGNWELALAAYNAGPGNVQKYGGIPPFKETQQYVPRVLQFAQEEGGGSIPDFTPARERYTPGTAVPRSVTPTVDLASLASPRGVQDSPTAAGSITDLLESLSPRIRRDEDRGGLPMPTVPLSQPRQPLIPDRSQVGAPDTGLKPEGKDALDAISRAAESPDATKPKRPLSPRTQEQKDFAKEEPEKVRSNWQAWLGGLLRGSR